MNMTCLNPIQPIELAIHFTGTHVIFLLEPKFGTKPFPYNKSQVMVMLNHKQPKTKTKDPIRYIHRP